MLRRAGAMVDANEIMRATVIVVFLSAVAIGCAQEASEPPRVAARDSAGITIVAWDELDVEYALIRPRTEEQ